MKRTALPENGQNFCKNRRGIKYKTIPELPVIKKTKYHLKNFKVKEFKAGFFSKSVSVSRDQVIRRRSGKSKNKISRHEETGMNRKG